MAVDRTNKKGRRPRQRGRRRARRGARTGACFSLRCACGCSRVVSSRGPQPASAPRGAALRPCPLAGSAISQLAAVAGVELLRERPVVPCTLSLDCCTTGCIFPSHPALVDDALPTLIPLPRQRLAIDYTHVCGVLGCRCCAKAGDRAEKGGQGGLRARCRRAGVKGPVAGPCWPRLSLIVRKGEQNGVGWVRKRSG